MITYKHTLVIGANYHKANETQYAVKCNVSYHVRHQQ